MSYFSEGNKSYNKKEYEKAIDCYKKSVSEKENEACSLYNLGVCFIKLKNYKSAILMLQKAIELQRESKYYFNLGYCYAMLNVTDKALLNFNVSWALNNNDFDCERAISMLTTKILKGWIYQR